MARSPCVVCGSKKWRYAGEGTISCEEGHIDQNYRHEVNEVAYNTEGMIVLTQQKKTTRRRGVRTKRKSEADPVHLSGPKGRYFYIQTQQLVLRLQIQALVTLWKLPHTEFETACKDVWAYHLLLLPEPILAAPIVSQPDDDGSDNDGNGTNNSEPDIGPKASDYTGGEAKTNSGPSDPSRSDRDGRVEHSSSPESSSDENKDPSSSKTSRQLDPDPELAKLLLREIEDSGTGSSSSESESGGRGKRRERAIFGKKPIYGSPAANIAVLVVACWVLRIPVIYMDFIRLIESYELPYLETLRLLDKTWLAPLTSQTWSALSPSLPPTTARLHRLASRLARNMYRRYGIAVPQFNFPPMLWRGVRQFCGNATLYALSRIICAALEVPFTLSRTLAPKVTRVRRKDGWLFKGDNAPPELSAVCAIIVALKMVYGLDNRGPRHPTDSEDPAAALPEVGELLAALRTSMERQKQTRAAFLTSNSERSVLDLNETEIDDYLDFAETALLRSDGTPHFVDKRKGPDYRLIMEQYRLQEREDEPRQPAWGEELHQVSERLEQNPVISQSRNSPSLSTRSMSNRRTTSESRAPSPSNAGPVPPAAVYTVFNSHDILGSLPHSYELVLEVGAKWVGAGKEDVAALVDTYERRLLKWDAAIKAQSKESRRNARGGYEDDDIEISDRESEGRGRPGPRKESVTRKTSARPSRSQDLDEDYDAAESASSDE
ncbi:hypothetical protein M407DRAFT_18259 [Tulasnella calospora MUT 4182]|uniref:Rrn7/TAF1B C-terminal cyclin domain-containing protein n=1 Tax=Tulasnella calospora MUT 4182 TaxID=1051891 RepID=A0A0C3QK45_9AGAM|nr:hypothetical protein M407DRAFT_18259 [Tulasnella calospora MUT 4182]